MPHSVSGVYLVLSSAIISVKKQGCTTCSHPWALACFPITLPSMLFCPQHCLSTATRNWTGLRFYFIGRVRAGLFLIVMWAFNTSHTVPLSVYEATGPQGLPYTCEHGYTHYHTRDIIPSVLVRISYIVSTSVICLYQDTVNLVEKMHVIFYLHFQ